MWRALQAHPLSCLFALVCGVLGFVGSYYLLGVLFTQLEQWYVKKLA